MILDFISCTLEFLVFMMIIAKLLKTEKQVLELKENMDEVKQEIMLLKR